MSAMTTAHTPCIEGDSAVQLRDLGMVFGKGNHAVTALNSISAVVPAGCITGLVGPDAAGKTTLMRILAGLMLPTHGEAVVFGRPPQKLVSESANSIGYMPQRFGLYEDISVMGNLLLHASLRGLEGQARQNIFDRLLQFTSLAPFTDRLAGRLSGGMKQKLGIACALLGSPRLLLLDEPGVGVDPQSRRELWRMVQDLSRDGMTVIWATAYLDEAERCAQVIVLDEGSVLYAGDPEDFTKRAQGRVFLLKTPAGAHRQELAAWSMCPGIEDALVQGSRIRLVLAEGASPELRREVLDKGGEAVPPRLEDAYMSAVGGIDQNPSPYGKLHVGDGAGQLQGGPDSNYPSQPSIEAKGLTKTFGDFTAARDITFDVRPGEIFGLLGPNGAGKSTTFRMLCGLSRPTSGQCAVDGMDLLTAGSEARAHLGYMAQKFSLYPDIPVLENIKIFAELYGLSRKRRDALLPVLANALNLQSFLRSRTADLPLGQKQRLALLCATLHEPPVLFLDEPTSGVDARTRRDFWKHISAMTTAGAAVLVTTHFMEEAEYCDRIALIYRGAMIRMGTPDELKASCKTVEDPTLEEAFIASIEEYDRQHPQ
ncbi:ATP-binding cassette domain-containing protein [Desulfovibrio intestinalis]|uniref:ABC-2 type transport system ATP-binding protein n=1 Tax=Desulfovibrio intestinalis TaxID=58621 RepID=A0A7W8BZP2_9BACT|nr:ATP-binding cassette domain-containing protein [Desulfovibrio intestinalis]MBB5142651.1 ABC-2 type transport system ATP-binding protein [Desulfovibrio intestinalis]